ncbi:hypothetical protein PPROV_000897000 [Pycnococcus provasolii]|uniref:Uncharacterized protein n=1 Tax=Pycnococcus provasolii TaxID=41880 RepID=A0A830HRX8_9CHLO|nr:hypothetical protein PPROV_000896800 [Pycnococcus provasolii]GHP10238.1 hypothetical protein PPROV_000897000 [Pycnococcus provasolii]
MVFGAGCGRCGYDADCEFNPPSGITADHCLILLRALQTCHVDEKAGVIRFLLRYVTSLYSSDQKRVFESCHPPLMHRSNAIRVLLAVPSGWWTGHIDRSSSADIASIPGKQGSITDEGRIAAAKCLLRHALAAHSGDDAGDDGATELNGGDDSLSGALELGKALAAMLKDGDESPQGLMIMHRSRLRTVQAATQAAGYQTTLIAALLATSMRYMLLPRRAELAWMGDVGKFVADDDNDLSWTARCGAEELMDGISDRRGIVGRAAIASAAGASFSTGAASSDAGRDAWKPREAAYRALGTVAESFTEAYEKGERFLDVPSLLRDRALVDARLGRHALAKCLYGMEAACGQHTHPAAIDHANQGSW